MTKNKKPYDYSELPDPPGYPPLPINNSPQQQSQQSSQQQPQPQQTQQPQSSPSSPPPPKKPSPMQPQQKQMSRQASTVHSRAEQQAVFLEQRQLKFKKAAMQAKSSGDMELAKKYMRMAKGFDQMIEASKSGLPVDLSQIPTPPGEDVDGDFVLVNASDVCSDDAQEVYKKLQDELLHQIKVVAIFFPLPLKQKRFESELGFFEIVLQIYDNVFLLYDIHRRSTDQQDEVWKLQACVRVLDITHILIKEHSINDLNRFLSILLHERNGFFVFMHGLFKRCCNKLKWTRF
ncbi:hypothetical protein HELRODRAFT_171236 [Helobdella robusta]|uniref:DM14 domain-containing protein n=1 Tax=Helobdella robusta TaxID=6412 RepID=T1F3Z3_HELRO|nr:hypothetical protein HELRODRAFT_171236 [Helobdella robusta]ESO05588.1 hypothetical protein HELRODRAFT_171236 [Helobdella robusta]